MVCVLRAIKLCDIMLKVSLLSVKETVSQHTSKEQTWLLMFAYLIILLHKRNFLPAQS
jgi:hypothetical protein